MTCTCLLVTFLVFFFFFHTSIVCLVYHKNFSFCWSDLFLGIVWSPYGIFWHCCPIYQCQELYLARGGASFRNWILQIEKLRFFFLLHMFAFPRLPMFFRVCVMSILRVLHIYESCHGGKESHYPRHDMWLLIQYIQIIAFSNLNNNVTYSGYNLVKWFCFTTFGVNVLWIKYLLQFYKNKVALGVCSCLKVLDSMWGNLIILLDVV